MSKARALQRMRPTVWRTLAQTCQDRGVDVPSDSGCLVPSIDLREAAVRAYQADAVDRYPWIGRADGWPGLRFGCALWNDNRPGPQMVVARAMGAAEGADIAYAMGTAGPEWMADAFDAPGDGADCSDLIAYCIGRRKAGGPDWTRASDGAWWWLSTDSVWSDARGPQLLFRRIDEPAGPCIAVYPDGHGRQGHIGLVVSVHGSILRGVDCSSSQYGRWDDAARLRDLSFFDDAKRRARGRLFCVPSWW